MRRTKSGVGDSWGVHRIVDGSSSVRAVSSPTSIAFLWDSPRLVMSWALSYLYYIGSTQFVFWGWHISFPPDRKCMSYSVLFSWHLLHKDTSCSLNKKLHVISYDFTIWVWTCEAKLLRGSKTVLPPWPQRCHFFVWVAPSSCHLITSPLGRFFWQIYRWSLWKPSVRLYT